MKLKRVYRVSGFLYKAQELLQRSATIESINQKKQSIQSGWLTFELERERDKSDRKGSIFELRSLNFTEANKNGNLRRELVMVKHVWPVLNDKRKWVYVNSQIIQLQA